MNQCSSSRTTITEAFYRATKVSVRFSEALANFNLTIANLYHWASKYGTFYHGQTQCVFKVRWDCKECWTLVFTGSETTTQFYIRPKNEESKVKSFSSTKCWNKDSLRKYEGEETAGRFYFCCLQFLSLKSTPASCLPPRSSKDFYGSQTVKLCQKMRKK